MTLPPELLREIIALLPQAQLVSCALVSPLMREFSQEILYRKVVLERGPAQLMAFRSALEGDSLLLPLVKVLKITLDFALNDDSTTVAWSAKGQDALISILALCSPALNKLYIRGSSTAKDSKDQEFSFLSLTPQTQVAIADFASIAPNLRLLSLASLLVPPEVLAGWLVVKNAKFRCIYAHNNALDVPSAVDDALAQTRASPSFESLTILRLHFLDDIVQNALLKIIGESSFENMNQIITLELQGPFSREAVTSLLLATRRTLKRFSWIDADWELPVGENVLQIRHYHSLRTLHIGFSTMHRHESIRRPISFLHGLASEELKRFQLNVELPMERLIFGTPTQVSNFFVELGKTLEETFLRPRFEKLRAVRIYLMLRIAKGPSKGFMEPRIKNNLEAKIRGAAPAFFGKEGLKIDLKIEVENREEWHRE